jgi:Restriction endonuclease/Topoisomerase DNA binding C4 zinc finger
MPRRRKNNEFALVELFAQLGGILLLLLLLAVGPSNFAALIQNIFTLLVLGAALLIVVGIGIFLFKTKWKRQNHHTLYIHDFSSVDSTPGPSIPRPPTPRSEPKPQPLSRISFLDHLRNIDWFQFEKLVALAYEYQGFVVTRRGGAKPDGGIDLVIEKDKMRTAIQCKQWKTWNVGVKPVREFLGALTDARIDRGIVITLNGYTGDARLLAEKHGIKIINEMGLAKMLDGSNLHQDPRALEILNDIKKYCPKCERLMVERVAGKGPNSGQRFWGCSGYPKCRFTMQMYC